MTKQHHRSRPLQACLRGMAAMMVSAVLVSGCGSDASTEVAPQSTTTQTPAPATGSDSTLVSSSGTDGTATPAASGGSATLPPMSAGGDDVGGALGSGTMDLFKAQATIDSDGSSTSSASSTSASDAATMPGTDSGFAPLNPDYSSNTGTSSYSSTKTYTEARISVNGKTYKLKKKSVFPSDTQQFVVRKISSGSVLIELSAGEFSDGSSGFELATGVTRKFTNQSEGITYTLKLIETS